ncbi:MAG TPA: HAD-IC family P-type ATPase, partial [Bacteroidota bacterium]|nr:HAD-IC family P-type ATPase [Bacteroidota bacterium]
ALVRECAARALPGTGVTGVRIDEGRGISGCVAGTPVATGTEAFVRAAGYEIGEDLMAAAARERADGKTITYYGIGERVCAGICLFGDELREGAREAVSALRRQGVRVALLSGDAQATVDAVAAHAGIEESVAGVLPEEKAAYIARLRGEGESVLMVGDGVNDAPALARADVGVAMGSGAGIALRSAGVTLLRDDVALVPGTLAAARRTVRIVRQNLAWAFFYNAAAMVTSSLSVVLNSMRLREAEGKPLQILLDILVPWRERGS